MLERFQDLLEEFRTVPKTPKAAPTFLEIAGQPHFENVI